MPLTTEQVQAAQAAQRMLADEAFLAVLTRIQADATQQAIYMDEALPREANRQLVLAIGRIVDQLRADADAPEAAKLSDQLARAFE